MPHKAQTPCTFGGCRNLAVMDGRCAQHPRPPFQRRQDTRPSAVQRGYDYAWRKIRDAFLKANPLCWCGETASHVDHQISKARGGTDDPANLRGICARHHSAKTAAVDGGFGNRRK